MEKLPSDGLCNYTTPFESLYENSFLWTRHILVAPNPKKWH